MKTEDIIINLKKMASNEKFWMYDVTQLFRSYELLPSPEDSLSAKLNTITRLALIVCIVIAAYKPVLAFSTLILVMVVTMSVYSGAVADPTIEGFEPGIIEGLTPATFGRWAGLRPADPSTGGSNQQLYEFMREYNSIRHPDLNKVGFPTTQKRFCNDAVPLEYGLAHISPNQELVGGPNPKTKIPPLVAAPSHDLDSWRNNDFVVHSQINKETNFDSDKAGYNCGILPTKCEDCMYVPCQCKVLRGQRLRATPAGDLTERSSACGVRATEGGAEPRKPAGDRRSLAARSLAAKGGMTMQDIPEDLGPLPEVTISNEIEEDPMINRNGDVIEGFREDLHMDTQRSPGSRGRRRRGERHPDVVTNRPPGSGRPEGRGRRRPGGGRPGGIPPGFFAHRRQIIHDLINNLGDNEPNKHKPYIRKYVRDVLFDRELGEVSDLEIDEIIGEIDKSLHPKKNDSSDIAPCFESPRRDNIITQTLQPGVFQKSHIGEPIQSNIGISYTQEWGPTEVQETNDMIKYTMRDPKNAIITPQIKEEVIGQDHANVYDPRFTGYGTSYRVYTDRLTGRSKFFYDDVEAITMPNYVTRSKVDVFPWANTYGPDTMMSQSEGDEYRQLANNAFTDSALTFRTEMQERLMRKRNAELWQRRVAPISTMGRLGSSMKSCL